MQSKKCLDRYGQWKAALSEVIEAGKYNAILIIRVIVNINKQNIYKFKERLSWAEQHLPKSELAIMGGNVGAGR